MVLFAGDETAAPNGMMAASVHFGVHEVGMHRISLTTSTDWNTYNLAKKYLNHEEGYDWGWRLLRQQDVVASNDDGRSAESFENTLQGGQLPVVRFEGDPSISYEFAMNYAVVSSALPSIHLMVEKLDESAAPDPFDLGSVVRFLFLAIFACQHLIVARAILPYIASPAYRRIVTTVAILGLSVPALLTWTLAWILGTPFTDHPCEWAAAVALVLNVRTWLETDPSDSEFLARLTGFLFVLVPSLPGWLLLLFVGMIAEAFGVL